MIAPPILTSRIVATHESGNAWYSIGSDGYARNAVQIQRVRNAQVPIIVLTAGQMACPLPRRTPAGISYRLQIGSNSKIHRIRIPAVSITAASVEKKPETVLRNRTMEKIGIELQTADSSRLHQRMVLHRAYCFAA